ncbi:MAG: ribonuclease P protein component [Anaerolineae bacterium]|nr:ribonuclease P protein component [Anaerolineae bacterium]
MLPRHLRLRRREDFEAARQRGRRWHDRVLVLNTLPSGLSHNRFGFVVSRRVGKAAVRNQVKRRLRAAIRVWIPRLAAGYDIVIIARPAASDVSYQELEAVLEKLFGLAGLLVPQNVDAVP